MDRLIDRLPSPGGLALWLYAAAFVILPALLAYAGFVYVLSIVFIAVGLRPHIEALASGKPLHFEFHWRGHDRVWDLTFARPGEEWAIKLTSWALMLMTVLILPLVALAVQTQAIAFYAQVEQHLPQILAGIDSVLKYAHQQLPGYVPAVEVEEGAGWRGVSDTVSQVAGNAIKDIKSTVQSVFGSLIGVLGTLLEDWIKLIIGAIIVGTILSNWDKEVATHRAIISGGIRDDALRANVLRFGELFQSGISLFMIGYIEVALTLALLFAIAMTVLPLGLGIATIVFMSLMLGFMTAVPKIGGFLGMAVALLLMLTNLEQGLGWFGYTVISFGLWIDILVRAALMIGAAKILGLMEAYNYTPEIIGKKLGMTKMQIIATVVIWAVGAGLFGMIWGILLSLAFQAALRLAEEQAAAGDAPAAND